METQSGNNKGSFDPFFVEHGYGNRFQGFQNLMRLRIRDILLVSSLYDLYLFEEDGRLYELIRAEYQGLNLSHSPELTRVSNGQDAVTLAKEENRFDLIITTMHIEDMHAIQFARLVKESGLKIPIVLLAHDNRELKYLLLNRESAIFDKIFIWQGDFRIIIAIIKYLEDKLNVRHDTKIVGVQSIIVIEDNVRYYSSFLPIIYTELLKQSRRLISEGINLTHKFLRMRARPKILLCSTYEEAWDYYEKYKDFLLGIISDIDFPHQGEQDHHAGLKFARNVQADMNDIPILLLSQTIDNAEVAEKVGTSFLLKDSPTLLDELRRFMTEYFSFGDFTFRTETGREVGRARDLKSLEEQLRKVPADSVKYHAERNHFSNWLKARTEFWLAHQLRPRKVTDYPSLEALREHLISAIRDYQFLRQRGIIIDFTKDSFDAENGFARIGGGSLGGKARGLGFVNTLINDYNIRFQFKGVKIHVPPAVVVATDVFDQFMEENDLKSFALNCDDDQEIINKFLKAGKFPEETLADLAAFLNKVKTPLAVRSSSLLEDSQYHPFAGVYETYMLPNNSENSLVNLNNLINTIKRVYASTFFKSAKEYIKVTNYRLEEEKMAVIIQKMVGTTHNDSFYPDFSGVAKSYNFYPTPPQKSSDGVIDVALGLGKQVVDGGNTVRFCPKYPTDLIQFYSVEESLNNSQRDFYILRIDNDKEVFSESPEDILVEKRDISQAEKDGSLTYAGSTFVPENDAIYDGLARQGIRVVTFGPILRNRLFPLPQILDLLLDMGTWGMGTPVEIEFAVNMNPTKAGFREFGLLQMRPLVISHEVTELDIDNTDKEDIVCYSDQVLGHGVITDIYDIVLVDVNKFSRNKTRQVAEEVSLFNSKLIEAERPYLLVGLGRWGTLDPWLGIPVTWEQIAGAKAIIETDFTDMAVEPSQGSHFFQNITSFMIAYFTVNDHHDRGYLDWKWLMEQPAAESKEFTRLVTFENPVTLKMNGHEHKGVILKPETKNEK